MTAYATEEGTHPAGPHARRSWPTAIVATAVVFVVLGAFAGWVWSQVAAPPEYLLYRRDYAYYASEAEFTRAFDTDIAFAVTGAVGALLGGLIVGWCFWRLGWAVTVLAGLAALGAAVVAWRLGIVLGPPSVADSAAAAQPGDTFAGPLELGARSVMLTWPIVALIGVMVSVWLRAPRDEAVYGASADRWNSHPEIDVQRP